MGRTAKVTVEFWTTSGRLSQVDSRYRVRVFEGDRLLHSEGATITDDPKGTLSVMEGTAVAGHQGCADDDIEVIGPTQIPDPETPRRRRR